MQFQASRNDFAIIISFSIGIEALESLFTWEKTKEISYDLGPGSSEGTQMNHDSDKDGLSDDYEIEIGLDPNKKDTDNDNLPDGIEISEYGTDPLKADTDNDGLKDGEEANVWHSNLLKKDSDNDKLKDGEEIKYFKK